MSIEEECCDKRFASDMGVIFYNNRHLAEWRLSRFTMIITVNRPICNVIRMDITSFRSMMANRLRYKYSTPLLKRAFLFYHYCCQWSI